MRQSQRNYKIAELVLHTGARVNRFEEKAGFATSPDLYASATPEGLAGSAISKDSVVDLTSKMRSDGTLDWTPSAGDWVVRRFGYSLTGAKNAPGPSAGTKVAPSEALRPRLTKRVGQGR
jgi:hypothetical protein